MALVSANFPERIVRVVIGSGTTGKEFVSPLQIEFKVDLTNGSKPNKGEVKLYNLSYSTVTELERRGSTLQLFVGEGSAGLLFAGDIPNRGVLTTVSPPNRITTIKAATGRRNWRESKFIKSYSPGTTRLQVLRDAIAATRIPLGYQSPALIDHIFATGWAFSGRARDAVFQLMKIDNSRASVQGGAWQIVAPGEIEPANSALITPNTGLKASPTRTKKGVSVFTVLNANLRPGRSFRVISTGVEGDFKCVKAVHTGDSRGLKWDSRADGVPLRRIA